jgi:hypothetical protein
LIFRNALGCTTRIFRNAFAQEEVIFNQDLYQEAAEFAATAHRDQPWYGADGQKLSYVLHFTGVAAEVIASLAAEPTEHGDLAVTCALLHDTVEDTSVTLEDVERRFCRNSLPGYFLPPNPNGTPRLPLPFISGEIGPQPHHFRSWRRNLEPLRTSPGNRRRTRATRRNHIGNTGLCW